MKSILSQLLAQIGERRKAIAAAIAPVVVGLALHFGFHVDVNTASTVIVAVISALAVHTTTNTQK